MLRFEPEHPRTNFSSLVLLSDRVITCVKLFISGPSYICFSQSRVPVYSLECCLAPEPRWDRKHDVQCQGKTLNTSHCVAWMPVLQGYV